MLYKNVPKHTDGMCYVYWIHLLEHKDIWTQGYVGATRTSVKERWSAHNAWAKQPLTIGNERLYAALNGNESLIYEVVYIGTSYDECLRLEQQYRPERHIGWNKAKGGGQLDGWFSGELAKIKAIKRWQSDPETVNIWWNTEIALLNKIEAKRKADAYLPHATERKLHERNSSGHTGCSYYKPTQKWRAQICIDRHNKLIGYYDTLEQAVNAYAKAKEESRTLRLEIKRKKLFYMQNK